MEAVTPRPISVPARALALPNLLTYGRIAAVPAVVACMYWQDIWQGGIWLRWVALAIFISAGVTDFLDGYFARKYGEQSIFGQMLDPIADKLLVASCLMMLAVDGTRSEEHTSELQSLTNLVCRLLLEKKKLLTRRQNSQIMQ